MRSATRRVWSWLTSAAVVAAMPALSPPLPRADSQPPTREVAVTFDDLPVGTVNGFNLAAWQDVTRRILAAVRAHRAPAIGFVNENKLGAAATPDPARVALLQAWLDAGLELGNHSYSHPDLHATPLDAFEDDVVRGEPVTKGLLERAGGTLRFFRHPFLHTGETLEKKQAFERFLAGRGYRVAPVTIDNDDYLFAAAYDRGSARRDPALLSRVVEAYVPYMEAKFAYYEKQSVDLFGREIRQVLLLHANSINARRFDALARMMESRGYRFITLDRALEDPAYRSPDTYAGPGGITWLHRWATAKGVDRTTFFRGEPDVPAFVAAAAR